MKRGYRRQRTLRDARRSQKLHIEFIHDGEQNIDCECEKSLWFFAKKGMRSCKCSKKSKGSPKYGHGVCRSWELRPSVRARREWRLAKRRDPYEI